MPDNYDNDEDEVREWVDAVNSVIAFEGTDRADELLEAVVATARRNGAKLPFAANTAYINTIDVDEQPAYPGDRKLENKVRAAIRWNAAAIVLKANKESSELGGHIASFQSAATLYATGFTHFWHAPHEGHGGDLIFVQGHSAPGIYARAFLEGRLTEEQLLNFRQEVDGKGISSYPHPWLMPDFWQFPTVSMGLGPLMAIYQARFLKYLQGRGLADTTNRHVWVFCGDGEMDEPESLGAISLAGREKLDNLIFVVNCNLQRLDGPVRGNGKIIQELEGDFRGAGWNVIKVVWGSAWDELLARDTTGRLRQLMEECVDGEYQDFKSKDGAYIREHFFGRYPETAAMVADWSDDKDLVADARRARCASRSMPPTRRPSSTQGQPTVILAKTVKGYGMGAAGEGQMITHQQKKMGYDSLLQFRDRFKVPLTDEQVKKLEFVRLDEKSAEMKYLRERRKALGGYLPSRRQKSDVQLDVPELDAFKSQLEGDRRRPRNLDDDGVRAHPQYAAARQDDRQARRADRARRKPHLRHGGHVPPVRHLLPGRPALSAAGCRPADVLQGGQVRADAAGRHQRSRRHVELDRGGDELLDVELPDDPVLHLLLDVRLPAHRRSCLGGRRHAGARLPDRRHLRAHDAQRRRAAARGRPQPRPVRDHSQLRLL